MGKKITLTKRGHAANQYLNNLREVKISDLKVGDTILARSLTHSGDRYSYKATVTNVSRSEYLQNSFSGHEKKEYYPIVISHEHPKYGKGSLQAHEDCKVTVYGPNDKDLIVKALEYQSTLTKTGRVSKRKIK